MATFPIYQLYIELEDYEPKMWRRFQIMNDVTLSKLAYILMTLFEIRNYYSYEFRKDELETFLKKHPEYARKPERLNELNRSFKKLRYGVTFIKNIYMYRTPKGYGKLEDVLSVKIKDVLKYENEEMFFLYDPEVNWKMRIVLEKVFVDKNLFTKELPKVLDGQGYGIIEDKAGAKDLEKFRNNLKRSNWNNKTNYKGFTPTGETSKFYFDKFNVDEMNFRVKVIPRAIKENFENGFAFSNEQQKVARRHYTKIRYTIEKKDL